MKLTIHTPDSAPEESRPVLAGIADDVGFVPNLAASVASSPTLLGAFDGLRRAVAASQLAREIVLTHGKVEDAAVSRLAELEFSAAEILDIVAECTFAGLVGVVDNLVGRVELDAFLAGRAWSA